MLEFVVASMLAERGVHNLATSALPDAPVVLDPASRVRKARVRRGIAAAMHHAADRLTPTVCTST